MIFHYFVHFHWVVVLWQHGAFVTFGSDVPPSLIRNGEDGVGPCWIFYFLSSNVHFATQQALSKGGNYKYLCVDPFVSQCGDAGWDQLVDGFFTWWHALCTPASWLMFCLKKIDDDTCFLIGMQHILFCWQVDCFPLVFWHGGWWIYGCKRYLKFFKKLMENYWIIQGIIIPGNLIFFIHNKNNYFYFLWVYFNFNILVVSWKYFQKSKT